jgi:hypothetical protein
MVTKSSGQGPSDPPPFDPDVITARELRHQPLSVIKTEVPALAEALGVTPAELFRTLSADTGAPAPRIKVDGTIAGIDLGELQVAPMCCHSDSW